MRPPQPLPRRYATPPNASNTPALILGSLVAVLVIVLFLSGSIVHLITESWWFEAIGFSNIFWTQWQWKTITWVTGFVITLATFWGNYALAMHLTRHRVFQFIQDNLEWSAYIQYLPRLTAVSLTFVFAFLAGEATSQYWELFLKSLHATSFGQIDPIFEHDLSFYIFQFPLLKALQAGIMNLLLLSSLVSGLVYALKGEIGLSQGWARLASINAKRHLGSLLMVLSLVVAWGFWLQRYELLYSPEGVVFGASYTDIHAWLPIENVMTVASAIVAVTWAMSLFQRTLALPLMSTVITIVTWLGLVSVVPPLMQKLVVEPNEITKEKEYVSYNINFTRAAYGLEKTERRDFKVEATLDQEVLKENADTIENIRLWDYQPLLSTYRQLQEIRLYYRFSDADIDRYTINDRYRQVMIAPRELSYDQVPEQAKTWVNQHLKYTHGYGIVMSPVNQVTPDGLPEFFIKDIPPITDFDNLMVSEPRIYYGESTNTYIFTRTNTPEFDYPQGEENALTTYAGVGGVPMGTFWRRLLYAIDRGSIQLPISSYFNPRSRIHYHRQIRERVETVAPFLRLDSDPYIVLHDGHLKWVVDAYTVSDRYPYSRPVFRSDNADTILSRRNIQNVVQGDINYIRNSVKVIVDAYDGTMQFIAMDQTDPVLATYRQMYPGLFVDRDTIDPELKSHFRYPLDLFDIQAHMYLAYHMENPDVFYNREDLWRFPLDSTTDNSGTTIQTAIEPSYTIVRLPGGEKTEFVTILPLTPVNKDNTIAWIAARSDGENYGRLLVYDFPKQSLVYGPSQIEARIDQNPIISQQLTLWSQKGSKVLRGNLLVIPLETSLLYIEPIYLRAEQGELPELKRVVVAYENDIVMEPTLDQALMAIFGAPAEAAIAPIGANPNPASTRQPSKNPAVNEAANTRLIKLADEAMKVYDEAETALSQGDWKTYGEKQIQLKAILEQMNR